MQECSHTSPHDFQNLNPAVCKFHIWAAVSQLLSVHLRNIVKCTLQPFFSNLKSVPNIYINKRAHWLKYGVTKYTSVRSDCSVSQKPAQKISVFRPRRCSRSRLTSFEGRRRRLYFSCSNTRAFDSSLTENSNIIRSQRIPAATSVHICRCGITAAS